MRETPVRTWFLPSLHRLGLGPLFPHTECLPFSQHLASPRHVAASLLAGGLGLLLSTTGCQPDHPDRPDLILLTIDSLSANQLACFGGDPDAGNDLCALAQDGTLFAWAAATQRGEASAAATALTGLPGGQHQVKDDGQSFLRNESTTITETLSGLGYQTAAFVATPRLNRSRRLDQGFDRYDDGVITSSDESSNPSIALAQRIQQWMRTHPSPRFIWIHADRSTGLTEFDRLISRLNETLSRGEQSAGILFAGLRGDPREGLPGTIGWATHRIPLLWRPPSGGGTRGEPRVSRRLAGLGDIAPTLRAAARIHEEGDGHATEANTAPTPFAGRNLGSLTSKVGAPLGDRFILLETPAAKGPVGLASEAHLYVRDASALDGTGEPVPTESLVIHRARFSALPDFDPLRHAARRSAGLEPGPLREDVLDAQSPVPRLEFHLARRLGAPRLEDSP